MWRNDPHNFFPVQPRDLEVILSEEILVINLFWICWGKKILLKYLSFVIPAFVCAYRTLTPVPPLVSKHQDTRVIIIIYSKITLN